MFYTRCNQIVRGGAICKGRYNMETIILFVCIWIRVYMDTGIWYGQRDTGRGYGQRGREELLQKNIFQKIVIIILCKIIIS